MGILFKETEENPNTFNNEIVRELSALGGSAAGAAAGFSAVPAFEQIRKDLEIRKHNLAVNQLKEQRDTLKTLVDLHTGNLSWDDITDEAKPILQQMYEENVEFLNNPQAVRAELSKRIPADVQKIPMDFKQKAKMYLPSKEMLANASEVAKHPAVAAGSLAGLAAGYALADRSLEKNKQKE